MITLTNRFRLTEHYVGAMKEFIFSVNPPPISEITNAVQSVDVSGRALAISQPIAFFPNDTVHIVVVDQA